MDLSDLNEQQKNAVLSSLDRNTVLIAGAGSGKTKTLTSRVGYILEDLGYSASNLMVVTFTNKAATELKGRIAGVCYNLEDMWIGTFHHICNRILKDFGAYIGIESFTIMDKSEQSKVIKKILKEKGIVADKSHVNMYRSKISKAKSNLENPLKVRTEASNPFEHEFAEVYQEYQNRTWENRTFDFDDLLVYAVLLLTRADDVRNYFNETVKFVMCDETQDTNVAQFAFLRIITGNNNLFIVGDDDQSIYGFRNAKPEYILNFHQLYPDAQLLMLEQNYRSTQTIVNASYGIVKNNTIRYNKVPFSNREKGDPVIYHECLDPNAEAEWIANEVLAVKSSRQLDKMVVLYRTNAQSRAIEEAFLRAGIPVKLIGATAFYERKEIKDIMAFLKFAVNKNDEASFIRAIGLLPGVGKGTIEKIIKTKNLTLSTFMDVLNTYNAKGKAKDSINLFLDIFINQPKDTSDFIQVIINKTGILQGLVNEGTADAGARLDNIKELINVAIEYENSNPNFTLQDFVSNVALMSSVDKSSEEGAVNLMTIHASKGLEFETVFIAGVEEKLLPHANSKTPDEIEEERRTMYVAASRAEKYLYITSCGTRQEGENRVFCDRSRFIDEIPAGLMVTI